MARRHYVYGIVGPWSGEPLLSRPIGTEPGPVEVVAVGDLSVVTSSLLDDEVLPVRRNTVGHTKILEELLTRGVDVLPMQFGVVVDTMATCARVIRAREHQLAQMLIDMAGKIEVGITVKFDREAVFREIVTERPAIASRRQALAGKDEVATYHDRVAIGQEVERLIRAKNEADRAEIAAKIAPLCLKQKQLPFKDDMTVLRSACLVDAKSEPRLFDAIESFSKAREPRCTVAYLAPVPPYNFVRANLDWGPSVPAGA